MNTPWDVIVVGGGPSGMMTALRARERGLSVLLLEKNDSLGKKLLITGGGRCNVLNGEMDTRTLLKKYGSAEQYLYSAFSRFGSKESLDFFHTNGMETIEEPGKRVFPKTEQSQTVWDLLVGKLSDLGVVVHSNKEVASIAPEQDTVVVHVLNGDSYAAHSVVVATGGLSRPETGSTGDGFRIVKALGVPVQDQQAAIVPLAIEERWVPALQGITLGEVKYTVHQFGKKCHTAKGKLLFTHFGISGPMVLNSSRTVGELLSYGEVTISIDVLPHLDLGALNLRLQAMIEQSKNRLFRNVLPELVPERLVPVLMEKAGISEDTPCHSVKREMRIALVNTLKALTMSVKGLMGLDKAVVTSGGVSLSEVDTKTMSLKKFPQIYVVGDMLDIDRPSGGYSLQLCWTTGWIAGDSVEAKR